MAVNPRPEIGCCRRRRQAGGRSLASWDHLHRSWRSSGKAKHQLRRRVYALGRKLRNWLRDPETGPDVQRSIDARVLNLVQIRQPPPRMPEPEDPDPEPVTDADAMAAPGPGSPRAVPLGVDETTRRVTTVELAALRKHTAIFAGSGSGKTVLIRRLIEECALRGVSLIGVFAMKLGSGQGTRLFA